MNHSTHTIRSIWLTRLGSALRTAVACTAVACCALYGSEPIKRIIAFPAFSYVTTILILSSDNITLGEALSRCSRVLCATAVTMVLSIPTLWVVGPAQLNNCAVAPAAVAVTVFMVAAMMPRSMGLLAKRIAFGQAVIVYVGVVVRGGNVGVVMHPTRVAASTGVGVLASILAVVLPWPSLAYSEVKQTCQLYAENALERSNLLVEAVRSQDRNSALNLISQAKSFSTAGVRLLQNIDIKYKGMLWERPDIRFSRPECLDPREKLRNTDCLIRGMELALDSCDSFPVKIIDEELRQDLQSSQGQMALKIEQTKFGIASDATTAPEIKEQVTDKSLLNLKLSSMSHQGLPLCFFCHCMEVFKSYSPIIAQGVNKSKPDSKDRFLMQYFIEKLRFALKCSISLGLAVLFGLMYDKKNGYWSGLTIAITFVTQRQATFTVANARMQGTAMGSVYGILGCAIFRNLEEIKFVPLIPWIIFTGFLRHSRMYGESGAIAAAIGAALILGRNNYVGPTDFAIARITEATIGFLCFIVVEILFVPARAATLARTQLSHCLDELLYCIQSLGRFSKQQDMSASVLEDLTKMELGVRSHMDRLKNLIAEAETEPNFLFRPFHGACYNKILSSLSKIADLFLFVRHELESLPEGTETLGSVLKELQEQMADDLNRLEEEVECTLKCLKDANFLKSGNDLQKSKIFQDIEAGEKSNGHLNMKHGPDEADVQAFSESYQQRLREAASKINGSTCEETLKSQTVLCLSGLGFCISRLVQEFTGIGKELKELEKWENPTRHVKLQDISCKVDSLHT